MMAHSSHSEPGISSILFNVRRGPDQGPDEEVPDLLPGETYSEAYQKKHPRVEKVELLLRFLRKILASSRIFFFRPRTQTSHLLSSSRIFRPRTQTSPRIFRPFVCAVPFSVRSFF